MFEYSGKTIADIGRNSSTVGDTASQESSNVEDLYTGATSVVGPRRSLTAVHNNVMNIPQAEDLSRTGKRQGPELGVGSERCRKTMMMSAQRPRTGV